MRQPIIFIYCCSKQTIHIISFEPITSKASANSFHELSITSVSIDVIGEFWRQRKENWLILSESNNKYNCNYISKNNNNKWKYFDYYPPSVTDPGFPPRCGRQPSREGANRRFCQIFPKPAWNWKNFRSACTLKLRAVTLINLFYETGINFDAISFVTMVTIVDSNC